MNAHTYSSDFYHYIDAGSRASAQVVSSLLLQEIEIASLVDIGAGHGAWAPVWQETGVAEVHAVDGAYVDQGQLAVSPQNFQSHDLAQPLDLQRSFDLVQSLEVAEHIAADRADIFVDNLARHGDVVLFSAAVPHQGGEHHVNEQPPEYWRKKFAERGYAVYDWLRPLLAEQRMVKPWYRFNSFIYATEAGASRLSPAIRAAKVDSSEPLKIGGDFSWAVRRAAVGFVPSGLVKPIAMAKASIEARVRGGRG